MIRYILVYVALLVLLMAGCLTSNTGSAAASYDIIWIDGHEYIVTPQGGITHKVN